jgi:hypothetical protein
VSESKNVVVVVLFPFVTSYYQHFSFLKKFFFSVYMNLDFVKHSIAERK